MTLTINRTLLGVLAALGFLLLFNGWLGLSALSGSNENLKSVYNDRVVPLRDLKIISDDYAVYIVDATHKVRNGNYTWEQGIADIDKANGRIKKTWDAYLATLLTKEEEKLIKEAKGLFAPADRTIAALRAAMVAKDTATLDQLVKNELYQTIDPVTGKITELADLQVRVAGESFDSATADFEAAALLAQLMIVLGIAAALAGAWVVRNRVIRPIDELVALVEFLAADDFAHEVPHRQRADELGAMARAIDVLKMHGLEAQTLRDDQERQREEAELHKRQALQTMADRVESESRTAVDQVSARTKEMGDLAEAMALSVGTVSHSSQSVAAAAHQALHNSETVAAASEELAASIREISSQVSYGTNVSKQAVASGDRAMETISSLSEAVARIGEVATLISDIASQTNLLALNATIEAARAGEAGKGFAVVAGEVKNLATQTARSTEEITRQITSIQAATKAAVDAVSDIGRTIQEMDQISGAIAAAIEEQGAATQEISRNVLQAADAAREVSSRIAFVSDEATKTGDRATTVRSTAADVSDSVAELNKVLVRVVRTSMAEVNRRETPRTEVATKCSLIINGQVFDALVRDISIGGALISDVETTGNVALTTGRKGRMRLNGADESIPFSLISTTAEGARLKFHLDEGMERILRKQLSQLGQIAA